MGVASSQEILGLPHNTRARAAGLIECLQRPPTKSERAVYFLLIEDEHGLLQATVFEGVYERYGHLLHQFERIRYHSHARQRMAERNITEEYVLRIINDPDLPYQSYGTTVAEELLSAGRELRVVYVPDARPNVDARLVSTIDLFEEPQDDDV